MQRSGFTLIELIIVTAIIVVLIAVLIPALSEARDTSRRVACLANLNQIGLAITSYAHDYDGSIPYGPHIPGPPTVTNLYTNGGMVTNLITTTKPEPAALGLLVARYFGGEYGPLYCPGADQPDLVEYNRKRAGTAQTLGWYYYRHNSVDQWQPNWSPPAPQHIRLHDLGLNSEGGRITALAMDVNYLVDPSYLLFGVYSQTNHEQKTANMLYADGHAAMQSNDKAQFTIDAGTNPWNSLPQILAAFERADRTK